VAVSKSGSREHVATKGGELPDQFSDCQLPNYVRTQVSDTVIFSIDQYPTLWIPYPHAGMLARSQYSEGPATDHFDTGFSWFLCA